ncbi:MAG: hypothetical protein E7586_03390 [Ruminococcaceae bacterium]|nr:hypothetical protein [Oscillospiraceae bacterium]
MKRALSVILALAMLVSMLTVFAVTPASAATVIKNNSPAITATVGTKIALSNYSVTFDGDTSATSNVTWKNGSTTITEFTPTAKGVTTLTATSGSKTKNIYVVAKNASDSEYVLYEANLADFASTSALTSAGWTLPDTASIADSALSIKGNAVQSTAYLPAWLGDFGNYGFSANVKLTSVNEDTRWFALVYRSDNRAGTASHYQMCIRNNTTAANGIEFSEFTTSGWNVISKAAASYSTMADAYRVIDVKVSGNDVKYSIGGTQVLYMAGSSYTSKTGLTKGHLGLTASGTTLSVKSVKVVLQESVPEQLPSGLNLIYNNYHPTENLVTPIANVQKVTSVSAANLSNLSVAYFDLTTSIDATAALKAAVAANVVPTFYVTTNAQVDKVVAAISSAGKYDVNVISNTASVLAYLHGKNSKVRRGLVVSLSTELADGVLTSKEADAVRKKVRSAPATFAVVDSKYASAQAVNALNELAVAVWVNVASTQGTDAFRLEAITALTSGAHGIISGSASAIEEIIANDFAPNTFTRLSAGIGHAGNYDVAEENTMESFIAAYENGADILELDMGITSDGVPVLLHDNTLNRTTTYTGTKNIWEMTWAEVQQYPVVNTRTGVNTGKPIPKFEELLQFVKGKDLKLFVEYKWNAHDMIPKSIELIKKYDMLDQCDFLSFYGNCLNAVLSLAPGASTSFIYNNNSTDIKGTNATYAQSLLSLDHWISNSQYYKSTISCPRYVPITNDLMQAATDRGMTVWPWTYDTKSTNDAFFACVDGMTMINAQDLKDMVKTVSVDNLEMFVGQTYTGGALTATTYSRYSFNVSGANTVAAVVSGDAVKVENGKLVAVKEGTAKVIFGCKTNTYMGSEYVVYTQPVDVTVGGNSASVLRPLVEMAETATLNSLSEADLDSLRQLYTKAKALLASDNPSEDEVKNTASAMSKLIEAFATVSYTTTAPNYDYWDASAANMFYDDGIRLMDGKKQSITGDSSAYSAWTKTSAGVVDITVDYSTSATKDTFKGYFAHDNWGVYCPSAMDIYYSDNGSTWTKANVTLSTEKTKDATTDLPWALSTVTATSATPITARYFRFTITPGYSNGFIWVDEIELLDSNASLSYVSNVNTKIAAGDCTVFNSSFGEITNSTANIKYTAFVIAKWDSAEGAYVIKETYSSNTDGKTFNLASDEILLAAHDWESNLAGQQAVVGSAFNKMMLSNATVGQKIQFVGIDTDTWEFNVAPGFKLVTEDEPEPTLKGDINGNGEIDAVDYTMLKRAYFGIYAVDLTAGDINGNGDIDAVDYTMLKRAYFGIYAIN